MENSTRDLGVIPAKSIDIRTAGGVYFTRCQLVWIGVLFVLLLVSVGLMAGLIRRPCVGCVQTDASARTDAAQGAIRADPWLDVFLPDYVVPVHYELHQYPDFYEDGSVFYGRETIEIRVDESTRHLLVHIKDMNVTVTEVRTSYDVILPVQRTFAYEPNQYWVTELVDVIPGGSTVRLYLEFTGSLTNGIVGYYKSTYINSNTGVESWLATSKFQPSDARKAFPNFDEPRFKAEFTVTLRHWQNFTALSNMPVSSVVDEPAVWRETTFQRTPPMSSYLVVFIVSDFIYKETFMNSSKSVKIWAQPDKISQVDYALGITKTVMDYLQPEFGIPYHLPKLDSLAVPDYPSGATEHWGLVTYRTGRLLYDAAQVSDYDKQRVAMIVSHEMAHNYFGNPVTCRWWDDLWLNEGFAVFYEAKGTQHAEPQFNAINQMVVSDIQAIMETDGSNSSRPLLIDINTPDESNAAFDGITYDKGFAVLRMMESFLGEDIFLQGVKFFLNDFEYQSVVTQDLWDSMQKAVTSDLNVTQIMEAWVYQRGLPIINVTSEDGYIRATQQRFMKDPDADITQPVSPYGYKWYIPITYITQSGVSALIWMNGTESVFFHDPTNDLDWIKFNSGQTMYYRVNYSDDLFRRLLNQISANYTVFSPLDRANLLDDAFNIARAGQNLYAGVLNMTLYMTAEVDWEPWKASRSGLTYISDMLYTSADYSLFRAYVQDITGYRMDKLKVQDGGTHMEKLNRQDIINLSCGHGYSQCIQNTTRYFAYWLQNDTVFAVPTNIRRVVYSFGMQAIGGDEEFAIMWDRYTKATSTQEADNILYGLTWTDKLWLIQKLLDYSMDETKIRSQDFFTLMDYIAQNKVANGYLWDWVRANYDYIVDRFGLDNRDLGRMVPNIVSNYNTQFQLDEVESFYAQYPDAGTGEQARADSLDSIQNNIKWLARSEEQIIEWLTKYG